jgi:hypothetical protein
VRGFTWGRLPAFLIDPDVPGPEVLLAADCLYDSSRTSTTPPQPAPHSIRSDLCACACTTPEFEDFVSSVSLLLRREPTSLLLMTYHERR